MVVASLFGSLLSLPLSSAPAGAAPRNMDLAMVSGGGTLMLRGAEEPAQLGAPTTLTGTMEDRTGALTGGVFTTPTVEYQFDITSPIATTVYVEATFSEVTPGTVTGALDDEGNLTVDVAIRADLHIEVGSPAVLRGDCTASPISLHLSSTAPYDREGTERVMLRDPDFTIPVVPSSPECHALIVGGVNERLAGGGHSLDLVMQGEIPEVKGEGEETVTALSVEPAVSRASDDVVLTAAVTQVDGGPEVPTGTVEFRDGPVVVGSAALDGTGRASLTVSDLVVGQHVLSARYIGDGALFQASRSAPVAHLVAAAPTVEIAMGDTAQVGGAYRAATVTVTNPEEFGDDIVNGRIDLTIGRTVGVGELNPDRLVVERLDEGAWEPVTLTSATASSVAASLGPATGFRLDAGTSSEVRLRLRLPAVGDGPASCDVSNLTCPGPVELVARLVQVDAEGAIQETLAEGGHQFMLVEALRRATTLTIPGGLPRPHTARAGHTVEVIASIGPNLSGVRPTGFAEVLLDGRQVPVRRTVDPFGAYSDQVVVLTSVQGLILLPPDIDPGTHIVTVRYLGDQVFLPQEVTTTFTVLPSSGHPFVCQVEALNANHEFGVNVTFDATVPASGVPGEPVDLDISEAVLSMNRPSSANPWPGLPNNALVEVGQPQLEGLSFIFGPEGTGQAATVTRSGATPLSPSPNPADESQVDQRLTFGAPTGSVTIQGEPGDVVPVTLDEIAVDLNLISPPISLDGRCRPVGGPMVLGEVEVAGTSVSVSPGLAREGTDVVDIEARVFPADAAGTVTFSSDRDGTLGTVAVKDGVASWSAGGLSPGTHVVTAAFDATDSGVPDSVGTAMVTVSYSPRSATEAFVVAARTDFLGSAERDDVVADAGALDGGLSKVAYLRGLSRSDEYLSHVVEGLYRDTLGRSADEAGRVFWVGRLRGGWSVAQVTASFYGSGEYFAKAGGGTVESWIDDLYVKLLGRASDPDGRAFWVAESARIGRGSVARRFFQSPESARARVVALYARFLLRTSSRADQDFWAPRVIAQGDLALAVELTLSGEYDRRADNRFPLV